MDIRFRVWDGEEMWYPAPNGKWGIGTAGDLSIITGKNEILHRPDAVATLSTGRKVGEGEDARELYFDDFIATDWMIENEKPPIHIESWATLEIAVDRRDDFRLKSALYNYKVVGNIYENPELVKGE